jgi:alpha-1,3-rhamnosyl/mannosyltransferase
MFALASYRFCVVPLEVNPVFSPQAHGTAPRGMEPGDSYIMAFASRDGRKNHKTAMEAHAALLPRFPDLKLALVCSHPGVKEKVEGGEGVLPLGPVSMEELIWLYRNARALVFPSFDEGFGLPPVEAMACGTPVIASNAGSLPEVTGGCACLAEPLDVKGFAEGIRLVLEDDAVRGKMVEMGLRHVKRYARESMGRELAAAYQRVVLDKKRVLP